MYCDSYVINAPAMYNDPSGCGRKPDIQVVDYAVKKFNLSKYGRRVLHDSITGQGLSKAEILSEAAEVASLAGKHVLKAGLVTSLLDALLDMESARAAEPVSIHLGTSCYPVGALKDVDVGDSNATVSCLCKNQPCYRHGTIKNYIQYECTYQVENLDMGVSFTKIGWSFKKAYSKVDCGENCGNE